MNIDWTACDARGACTELLPEILTPDDHGYPIPRDRTKEPSVPRALHAHAVRATKLCPRLALHLREDAAT